MGAIVRRITANEAVVKTAQVEVKALTISGKQVTLSVFRQLKLKKLIDFTTGNLVGVPWGIVNYFWGDCAKDKTHLHVVWQEAESLYRDCIYPKRPTDTELMAAEGYLREMAEKRMVIAAHLFWSGVAWDSRNTIDYKWPTPVSTHRINVAGLPVPVSKYQNNLPIYRVSLESWLMDNPWSERHEQEAVDDYQVNQRRVTVLEAAWERQYALLENLDHLFIAV